MSDSEKAFRRSLGEQRQEWDEMRAALRPNRQTTYDQLWNHVIRHAHAVDRVDPDPMVGILMAICLGQQRELRQLKNRY